LVMGGRVLLVLGGLCVLVAVWLAAFGFLFGRGYGHSVGELLPGTLLSLGVATAMFWIVLRFWRGGWRQRGPRIAAGLLAFGGLGLGLYAAVVDPGDAIFTVPVLGIVVAIFGGMVVVGRPR
jgi:hypothetical protein